MSLSPPSPWLPVTWGLVQAVYLGAHRPLSLLAGDPQRLLSHPTAPPREPRLAPRLCLRPPRPRLSRHKAQASVTPSGLGSNAASSWGPLLTDRASDNLLGPRDQAGTCARTADPRSARGPPARGRRGSGMLCARLCARGARLTLLMASAPTGARPARWGVDVRQRRRVTESVRLPSTDSLSA